MKKIRKGDNIYVESPQQCVPDCCSITGDVIEAIKRPGETWFVVDAYVAKMGGGYPVVVAFRQRDLGIRTGTPISQLCGRPGYPGYARFKQIASSWGYD